MNSATPTPAPAPAPAPSGDSAPIPAPIDQIAQSCGGIVRPAGDTIARLRANPNRSMLVCIDLLKDGEMESVFGPDHPYIPEMKKILANPSCHDPRDTMCQQIIILGLDGLRALLTLSRGPRWVFRARLDSGHLVESAFYDDVIEISNIVVVPKYRRKGLAEFLLRSALATVADAIRGQQLPITMMGPISKSGLKFLRGINRKHIHKQHTLISYCGPEGEEMAQMYEIASVMNSLMPSVA